MAEQDVVIDYNGIQDTIEAVLDDAVGNDGALEGCKILIEEEPAFGLADYGVAISVFMDNRDASSADQLLGAGKRTKYHVRVAFWVTAFDLESYRACCRKRNVMLAKLESLLMKNRNWNDGSKDLAETSWLEGGVMFSARNASNQTFAAAAEVILTIETSILNA